MLVTQGNARDDLKDRRLAAILAGTAGSINGAAFQAVGFFAANMTGNVSILSDRIALGRFSTTFFYLGIILMFIVGAFASTLFINAGYRRDSRVIYAMSILIEGVLMGLLGVIAVLLPMASTSLLLVLGSSFLMGWQNAVVTRISGARVRTTHVSGMVTDIGIELALGLDGALGRSVQDDRTANGAKLRLHCWTVASFLAGGIVGVFLFQRVHGFVYLLAAAVLVVMSVPALIKPGRQTSYRKS